MDRCWLPGELGDALQAVLCGAGYNLRWLMRAVQRLGLKALLLRLYLDAMLRAVFRLAPATTGSWGVIAE